MSRLRNSKATDTNFTGPPVVQTTQLNNLAPPIIPPQPLFPSSQPYQIPDGYVVHSWDAVRPSTHVGVNQNVLGPQFGGRRITKRPGAKAIYNLISLYFGGHVLEIRAHRVGTL